MLTGSPRDPASGSRSRCSSQLGEPYRADLVRIIHGDANPVGPGLKFDEVPAPFAGTYKSRFQPVHSGSCRIVVAAAPLAMPDPCTIVVRVQSWLPDELPAEIAPVAYQNKAVVYDLLFLTAAETLLTIAADPKHLGARIGATAVLHTWGSAMTHHPHVHMIVPGGGISLDGTRWIPCRPGFLLPVRVLSRLFRRLFLAGLADAHAAGRLMFFGEIESLRHRPAFTAHLAPLRRKNWFVYAKPPFAGTEAVLAYLARYTHRVAIANSRLLALDERGVTFRYKDYRRDGQARYRTMTLAADEFIRRFLLHVLPKGFHRIRHYGLLARAGCKANIARARELIAAAEPPEKPATAHDTAKADGTAAERCPPCPCCGGRMIIVEFFERGSTPRGPPSRNAGIGT